MSTAARPDVMRDVLGCEHPIAAFSHSRDVVVAVSESGGIGVLGALSHSPEELAEDLKYIKERVGGRFGVDLVLPTHLRAPSGMSSAQGGLTEPAGAPAPQAEFLRGLLEKYGVPGPGASLTAVSEANSWNSVERTHALIDVTLDSGARLIASGLGPVPREISDRAHASGLVVAGLIGRSDHVAAHLASGADIIVAQGTEAGGHTGEVGTMVLTPEVVDLAAPTPVLAAGGICRGRHLAAALALGAVGVWTGSIWLATQESELTDVERDRLLAASSHDTVRSKASSGSWARQLRTPWTEAWDGPEGPGPLRLPYQDRLVRPAKKAILQAAVNGNPGALELLTPLVGQVVGSMHAVRPAREVFADMVAEYTAVQR